MTAPEQDAELVEQTDNSEREEDGEQDVTQDGATDYSALSVAPAVDELADDDPTQEG